MISNIDSINGAKIQSSDYYGARTSQGVASVKFIDKIKSYIVSK